MTSVTTLEAAYFEHKWRKSPLSASFFGIAGYDHLLPDLTVDGALSDRAQMVELLAIARECDPVDQDEELTLAVITEVLEQGIAECDLDSDDIEMSISGTQLSPIPGLLQMIERLPMDTSEQEHGVLQRLRGLPELLDTATDRHRRGIAAGRLPVAYLVEESAQWALRYAECLEQVWPEPQRDPCKASWREAINNVVRPALQHYAQVLEEEIAPAGRPATGPGLCWIPRGEEIYAQRIAKYTQTDSTAQELHDLGLHVMNEIHAEISETGKRAFGEDDITAVLQRLRTDTALRWSSEEEMLAAAREALSRAAEVAPAWFARVPKQPCEVRPVPEANAPGSPTAYYTLPSLDGTQPGVYYLNTYRPEHRCRHIAQAIAYHEGIPGHHNEKSLLMGDTPLSMARRLNRSTAYTEGWGLYAERLADEMGLYSTELDRLGMLCMQALRAARLVIDTGIHALGWSRADAVKYLFDNTDLELVEINEEVDRYIIFAGQALAYMVGYRTIRQMRDETQAQLGDRFDPASWHDAFLRLGPLPLTTCARRLRAEFSP